MKRQFKLISAILLVVMVATACAVPPTATPTSPPAPTATTAPPTKAPTVAPSATPEPTMAPEPTATAEPQADTVTVVDSLGEEVPIPQEVQRVASMRSGITEIICALGQVGKIIAVDEMVKVGGGYGAFIASIHPELMERTAPFSGRNINTEEMLKIAPDVVLHGGYGRIKQAEALKEQAPELPVVIAHFETIEHYMDDIRIVAQCVDAEDRAEELISTLQNTLDLVTARVADIPEAEKVRVYYGGHDIYHAYGGETFEHSQIVVAGGVNVAADLTGWMPEVSSEQLLVWDPQVVVLLNGADVDAVLNDPKLTGLSAVKNEQVYSLPEASWDFSSPRALFCIEWLASKFYPDRFANVDIEAEADKFYQNVFGVNYNGPSLVHGHGAPATQLTEAPAGDFSVAVNGTVFDAAALQELEQVETMEIDLPTGVRILDLLAAAGATGKSVTLIADDGYQYMVDYAALDDKSVLAYTRDGKLNAVMPGFDMGAWVRSVIEIQVSAAATAAVEEKPAAPAAPEGEFTITVGDVIFDAAKLGALEQVETSQADTPIGVRVLDLLAAAGVTGEVITLIASDGYQAEVPVADLNDDCVLAYTADGKLNAVMGDLSKATWVKDVVQITGAGGAEPEAAALIVNGVPLRMEDLLALEQVTVETADDSYTGVRVTELLAVVDAAGKTITLIADDGYEAEVAMADLTENCILALGADGKLNAVMLELSKGTWVKGTVEIKVTE